MYEKYQLGVQVAPRAASGAGGQTVVPGSVQQPQDAAVKSSQQVI